MLVPMSDATSQSCLTIPPLAPQVTPSLHALTRVIHDVVLFWADR